jgi:hypothetical protein
MFIISSVNLKPDKITGYSTYENKDKQNTKSGTGI